MNTKVTYCGSLLTLLIINISSLSGFSPADSKTKGGKLYQEYCSACHGINGQGDGELAYLVYPKPRDLSKGSFKIRSTPAGMPPTDADLNKTITLGLPGTAMPAFNFLDDPEIKSLVSYIKELGNITNQGVVGINIPDFLPPSRDLVELGKAIYKEMGCDKCHGETGKGDGPSSKTLIDSWGYPIIPRDFTSGVYLGGGGVEDLYLRFVSGLDGTPMPSYGNLAEGMGRPKVEEDKLAWGLVHYVKSLEKILEESTQAPQDGKITAAKTNRFTKPDQFMDVSSNLWNKADSYSIPISRLWQSDNVNYQLVNVQALFNSKYIAVKLEWNDNTADQNLFRVQDFQDGAAVQFSIDGSMGFPGMGSKEHPTDIWFWKAEWQIRKNKNLGSDLLLAYADRVSDADVETYPQLINDKAYNAGVDAGNINSVSLILSPVENVTAVGPQTLTSFAEKSQNISGKGVWDGDKWRVVFVRKMRPGSNQKINFKKGASIPIAFAVWNGSERDRNGQKMVSTWYELELKD